MEFTIRHTLERLLWVEGVGFCQFIGSTRYRYSGRNPDDPGEEIGRDRRQVPLPHLGALSLDPFERLLVRFPLMYRPRSLPIW